MKLVHLFATVAAISGLVGAAPAVAKATAVKHAPAKVQDQPQSSQILSSSDEKTYSAAFAAVRRGDFSAADEALARVSNKVLVGRVMFEKLMHPAYPASFSELKTWLDKYHDQPEADRVWTGRPADGGAGSAKAACVPVGAGGAGGLLRR